MYVYMYRVVRSVNPKRFLVTTCQLRMLNLSKSSFDVGYPSKATPVGTAAIIQMDLLLNIVRYPELISTTPNSVMNPMEM